MTTTVHHRSKTIDDLDDLSDVFQWIRQLTPRVMKEELEYERKRGNMLGELTFKVNDRPTKHPEKVKLWQSLAAISAAGPIADVARFAFDEAFRRAVEHKRTGEYESKFDFQINGQDFGPLPPDESDLGPMDIIYLRNIAGVRANVLEAWFLPDGVLWGTFHSLKSRFGAQVSLRYYYGPMGPIIQIANPTKKLYASRAPGSKERKRRRLEKATGPPQ